MPAQAGFCGHFRRVQKDTALLIPGRKQELLGTSPDNSELV